MLLAPGSQMCGGVLPARVYRLVARPLTVVTVGRHLSAALRAVVGNVLVSRCLSGVREWRLRVGCGLWLWGTERCGIRTKLSTPMALGSWGSLAWLAAYITPETNFIGLWSSHHHSPTFSANCCSTIRICCVPCQDVSAILHKLHRQAAMAASLDDAAGQLVRRCSRLPEARAEVRTFFISAMPSTKDQLALWCIAYRSLHDRLC